MLTPWLPRHTTALAPPETWSEPGPMAEMDYDQQERRWRAFHGVLLPLPPEIDGDGPDLRAHYGWLLCGFAGAVGAGMLILACPNPWAMFAAGLLTLPCLGAFVLSQSALSRAQAAFETAEGQADREML